MTENGNGLITIQIEVLGGLSVAFQPAASENGWGIQQQNLTL